MAQLVLVIFFPRDAVRAVIIISIIFHTNAHMQNLLGHDQTQEFKVKEQKHREQAFESLWLTSLGLT